MSVEQLKLLCIIIGMTLVSGFADSQGFIHAAKMWENGSIVWTEFLKSAVGFVVGITTYWVAVKYLGEFGLLSPEIQTLIWFGVTMIGVALVSRRFFSWQTIDQIVGAVVFMGVCWLLSRTGA